MAQTTSKTGRGRARAGTVLACALLFTFGVSAVRAEPSPLPGVSSEADAAPLPLADRAKAVLEAHCPDCRVQYGATGSLDLAALADDPGFITPGFSDASPVYRQLVAPRSHAGNEKQDTSGGDSQALSSADIEAVRDWIDSLTPREDACRNRKRIQGNDVEALMRQWRMAIGEPAAAGTRFVSLAHLWNACVAPERLMELRVATATLLAVLMRRREDLNLETLGDESALLAITPGEQALETSDWSALTSDAPLLAYGAVPADWLAARVLSSPKSDTGSPATPPAVRFDGVAERAVSGLARFWTRDVDLVRAAAERGVTPDELRATLLKADGDLLLPARRLAYGVLSREAWQRLSEALDGRAKPPAKAKTPPDGEEKKSLDVVLWPDRAVFRPRDLVTFNVRVEKACHLTLIGVDGDGQAIVLFPNDLEPENLVAPGVTVKVPGHDAAYQFRFDKIGKERVIAVCQRHARRLEGVDHDYERQRFTILGDWRTFLRTAPALEKEIREKREAEEARRKRRRRPALEPEPPPVDAKGPPMEGRAALEIAIEPGESSGG